MVLNTEEVQSGKDRIEKWVSGMATDFGVFQGYFPN